MYNNNGRPLTRRQTVRILILLTFLAWATQTLFHQWGFGQELTGVAVDVADQGRFLPSSNVGGAVIELKSEVTLVGAEVKLSQIARWNEADAKTLAPIADLVVLRLSQGTPYKTISMDEIRGLLSDAGVNLAQVRLSGAIKCTVARTDVRFNEGDALQKWLDAQDPKSAKKPAVPSSDEAVAAPIDTPPTIAVAPAPADRKKTPEPVRTLRDLISEDLASRLQLASDTMQLTFNAKDDRVLNLVEGVFKFSLEPVRAKDLGTFQYDVTITNNGNSQKTSITGQARAWQQQVVVMKPISFHQLIREEDLQNRKTLIDRLGTDPVITMTQAVGQQAARELKPGTVMTARLVDAVPLVRTGQLVTITYTQGSVSLRSVARATQGGSFGQSIQVKNETTGAIFEVILTGPQTATMSGSSPSTAVSAAR